QCKLKSQATALLAYLPLDKFSHVLDQTKKSNLWHKLVHRALDKVFEELRVVSKTGIVTLCADGQYQRVYLIVAGVSLDNEEQVQMSGIIKSRCLKCLQGYHG
ncbi:hypothetical protein FRC08_000879, partial [Ceratobasidium sp. 394]